jgi:hypothetical protein
VTAVASGCGPFVEVCWRLLWCSGQFSSIPCDKVDDTIEGSRGHCLVGPARHCLAAKPSQGQIWTGWLAPYSGLRPIIAQTKGQGFLLSSILSCLPGVGGGALLGDTWPPALDACGMLTAWVPISQVFT